MRYRTLRLRGTLAWRTAGGQGLCVGLDVSLLEVAGVGLITCEGVGVVKRVHTLFGGVHRLEVREEVQEIKDECEDEEVQGMEDSRSKRNAHHMRG